jgi:hypothetical protein
VLEDRAYAFDGHFWVYLSGIADDGDANITEFEDGVAENVRKVRKKRTVGFKEWPLKCGNWWWWGSFAEACSDLVGQL